MKSKRKGTNRNTNDTFRKILFFVFLAVMVGITIYLLPWIISLKDAEGRVALENYIQSKGAYGVLVLLGIQILQVIVAFIPGEPIEVIAGLLYGTLGGYLICTIGMLIGTIGIYYFVKLLGKSFINSFVNAEKLADYKFLHDIKRLEVLTFVLFFIPGTPKDLLTYFMPFTKIKPLTFFVIVTIARIPSIISSTFAGASIGDGKWVQTIVIFCVIGLVGILGIIFNDRLIKSLKQKKEKIKEKISK